jgi:transposase-like protein
MQVGVEASERSHNAYVNAQGKGAMNLVKLIEDYGSEDKCRAYLEELRWPEAVACPRCDSRKISKIVKRHQFDCDSCRYQFSVKAGTVFHDSHLPLWKWFLATYLMIESKKGMSANQLKRTLAVSYKTAWYLCHRIRSAMEVADPELLTGTVEVDETYVGGKTRSGKGKGLRNKTMVLGAVQRGGQVRFHVERRSASKIVLHAFIKDMVADDTVAIYTDQHPGYQGIADENTIHETVDHSADEWVRADVHTNTVENVWSLLKRSIVGSYHQLSAKHLPAYMDEIAFRFNNAENPYLFRDTLMALLDAEVLTYAELVRGE